MAEPATAAGVQPLSGTAAAAEARRSRAAAKQQITFSGEAFRQVVNRCSLPEGRHLRRMRVVELLAAMPGLGKGRAEELAVRAGVDPSRRLGGLGSAQVERLAAIIDRRAQRRRARRS